MNTTTRHDDPLHAAFEDDLPAYALGILDDASATRVEEHLASCPTCREALREYQEVVRLLPLALPVSQPPADARELLLAGASGGRPSGWRRWFDKRGPRGPRTRAAVAGLAVALALLIGFAVWFSTRSQASGSWPLRGCCLATGQLPAKSMPHSKGRTTRSLVTDAS
jgi:anti-sigma factor RsiW